MNKAIQITTLALAVAAMTSCATTQSFGSKEAAHDANKQTRTAAMKAGGLGCLMGAASGLLFGNKASALQGCMVGGVVSGGTAAVLEYRSQLKEARELADFAKTKGVNATVKVGKVEQVKEGTAPETKLDSLTLPLSREDVAAHGADTKAVIDRTSAYISKSKVQITVTVMGTKTEQAWIVGRLQNGMSASNKATIRYAAAASPALVISPAPDFSAG